MNGVVFPFFRLVQSDLAKSGWDDDTGKYLIQGQGGFQSPSQAPAAGALGAKSPLDGEPLAVGFWREG